MTISALAKPPHPDTTGRAGEPGGSANAMPGEARDAKDVKGAEDAEEYARRLMSRLHALGLRTSGPWESGAWESAAAPMAVSAQCVQVEPYVGRTVWLLPPPGGPSGGGPAAGEGLYWHWQRPRRDRKGRPFARWFQPFCPAADPDRAATAISEAIFADVRRRGRAHPGPAARTGR
ncbi:hypothetical protein F8568_021010 [Actinomadura sp. LD22]|uniref:Uncharacterized protein n=1 Tax=Actinomadura physcomitrii TaxID=2650748 RepID=A0A6I4MGG0_9ACTN|nr:hypothetical protein [Actinomadura physcomitrii]MWA02811.1 hypothetical protein [Actinomadura physcomitrii]